MHLTEKEWQVYVSDAWIATLVPVGIGDGGVTASFIKRDGWGNFAPWFEQAAQAHEMEDYIRWQAIHIQLVDMGLCISADDGETYEGPIILVNGDMAWFTVEGVDG